MADRHLRGVTASRIYSLMRGPFLSADVVDLSVGLRIHPLPLTCDLTVLPVVSDANIGPSVDRRRAGHVTRPARRESHLISVDDVASVEPTELR